MCATCLQRLAEACEEAHTLPFLLSGVVDLLFVLRKADMSLVVVCLVTLMMRVPVCVYGGVCVCVTRTEQAVALRGGRIAGHVCARLLVKEQITHLHKNTGKPI